MATVWYRPYWTLCVDQFSNVSALPHHQSLNCLYVPDLSFWKLMPWLRNAWVKATLLCEHERTSLPCIVSSDFVFVLVLGEVIFSLGSWFFFFFWSEDMLPWHTNKIRRKLFENHSCRPLVPNLAAFLIRLNRFHEIAPVASGYLIQNFHHLPGSCNDQPDLRKVVITSIPESLFLCARLH